MASTSATSQAAPEQKRRPGRPRLEAGAGKAERIELRTTAELAATADRLAAAAGISRNAWIERAMREAAERAEGAAEP